MGNGSADDPRPEPIPYWDPEPGDSIRGKIVDLTWRETAHRKKGNEAPVVTLDTGDGFVDVWATHMVLEKELARRDPQIGDDLEIWYDGVKPREGKSDVNLYRTANHSKVEHFDWKRGSQSEPRTSIRDAAREARSFEPPSDSYDDEPFDEPPS